MALQSYDAILSALAAGNGQDVLFMKTSPAVQAAGAFYSSWAHTGIPAAGGWAGAGGSTTATLVSCDSATAGAIPLVSPTTASNTNPHITTAGVVANASVAGTLMLVDRIADTGALTTASGGTCTLTMPGGGWMRNTDGIGVMAFIESLGGVPNASSVVSLSYTNTDSTAGRVSGSTTTAAASYRAFGTTGQFLSLQGSDKGIKSIESLSVTTTAALNIALVVCKPILMIPCITTGYYTERDMVIQTPRLPKLPVVSDKTSCLQWIYLAGGAVTPTITGSISTVTG